MQRRRAQDWRSLAASQAGLLARRQLVTMGHAAAFTEDQILAERWQRVGDVLVCTTTGPLTREQLMWAGVLHAGPGSAIGGLTALERHGLKHWHREEITVLLSKSHNLEPLSGVRFVETRRPIGCYATGALPTWRPEPAALLYAAYTRSQRTALGLLAATVQQRLSTRERLLGDLATMHPLRRSRLFRATLETVAEGAHSVAELAVGRMCRQFGLPLPDRQVRRRDGAGRIRYLDCQWRLANGTVVVLEVDGEFHMDVEHWENDIARERDLVTTGAVVLRCTAREIRDSPALIATSLRAIGVGQSSD
jgi:hypothetical protein